MARISKAETSGALAFVFIFDVIIITELLYLSFKTPQSQS